MCVSHGGPKLSSQEYDYSVCEGKGEVILTAENTLPRGEFQFLKNHAIYEK